MALLATLLASLLGGPLVPRLVPAIVGLVAGLATFGAFGLVALVKTSVAAAQREPGRSLRQFDLT